MHIQVTHDKIKNIVCKECGYAVFADSVGMLMREEHESYSSSSSVDKARIVS